MAFVYFGLGLASQIVNEASFGFWVHFVQTLIALGVILGVTAYLLYLHVGNRFRNPRFAFALLIYAGLEGIQTGAKLPAPADINLFKADAKTLANFQKLPDNLPAAKEKARNSAFVKTHIPASVLDIFCGK